MEGNDGACLWRLLWLDCVWEQQNERQPCNRQGQNQVEGLPHGIQNQWLTAFHLLGQLLEVGLQTDGDERKAEEPAPQGVGHRLDDARLHQLEAIPLEERGKQWYQDEGEQFLSSLNFNTIRL